MCFLRGPDHGNRLQCVPVARLPSLLTPTKLSHLPPKNSVEHDRGRHSDKSDGESTEVSAQATRRFSTTEKRRILHETNAVAYETGGVTGLLRREAYSSH